MTNSNDTKRDDVCAYINEYLLTHFSMRQPTITDVMIAMNDAAMFVLTKAGKKTQLAIIESGQAEMAEVFMPYAIMTNGGTLFKQLSNNPKLLLEGHS